MKKTLFTILFIAACGFTQAQEITAEEIVANYTETIGGMEAWSKIDNMVMTGSTSMRGTDFPYEQITKKDGKMAVIAEIQGKEMVWEAFDGETSWGINFMTMKPEKRDAETSENAKRTLGEFPDGGLMNYKKLDYKVSLEGTDNVDGVDCYKLKLEKKSILAEGEEVENIMYVYVDKENFIKISDEQEMPSGPAKGQMIKVLYSDYQEVDGLYWAFSINQKFGESFEMPVVYESIEFNKKTIDDSIFIFKEEEEK
jgi:hypothetical protein